MLGVPHRYTKAKLTVTLFTFNVEPIGVDHSTGDTCFVEPMARKDFKCITHTSNCSVTVSRSNVHQRFH